MWFAYLYRRAADATQWIPDPDEVAAAETEADCITALDVPPWDVTYELGVDALPPYVPDIRTELLAPVPRLFARVDTHDLTRQTYEYVSVIEDPDAPVPQPPQPLPGFSLAEQSVHAVHLVPPLGTTGQLLALDASRDLSWQDPSTTGLADGSVTTAKLADNAVQTAKILDATITGAKLATATITADKLAAGVLPTPPGAATESTPGLVQLATTAEVQAGTDTTKAVTPGRLVGRTATETRTGLVELATTAEAVTGTDTQRAVTPAGLAAGLAAIPAIPDASEATPGVIRLATLAQVSAGTDDTTAVTPFKLLSRTTNETRAGLVELATQAETTTGTDDARAVTPLKLAQRLAALPTASETVTGVLEIATQAETTMGTDDARAVTPLKLQQRLTAMLPPAATETVAGILELATAAETTTGTDTTRAVTPAGLAAKVPAGTALSVARYASGGASVEATPGLGTTSDGRLGIGVTPPATQALAVRGNVGLVRDDGSALSQNWTLYAPSSNVSLNAYRARGTEALPEATQANDVFLRLVGRGYDGSAFPTGARTWIDFLGAELWTPTTQGSQMTFTTTTQGTLTQAERLRLDGLGNVQIGAPGVGTGLAGGVALKAGSAATSSPADTVQLWVRDRASVAGKASLHVRTEDGTSHVLGDLVGLGTLCDATLGVGSYQALNVKGWQLFVGQSSVQERAMALIASAWISSTDATRTGRLTLSAYDAVALREVVRVEADGTAGRLSFYGATAVVKPTVTGSRGGNAALASVLTALNSLGLVTDSSTS